MRRTCFLALLLACGSDPSDRPGTMGTRGGDGVGGGGGGGGGSGEDGGDGSDGGRPLGGDDVRGIIRRIADLTRTAERGAAVPGAEVTGTSAGGEAVTAVSDPAGEFTLAGIDFDPTALLSVEGDPPSRVVVERARASDAVAAVIDSSVLDQVAASVGATVDDLSGHAFVWMQDDRHFPIEGLAVSVTSVSPVRGPFYEAGDPVLLSESGPTGSTGLIVLLAGLPDEYVLDVFPAADPDSSVSLTIEIEAGAVTFYEATLPL